MPRPTPRILLKFNAWLSLPECGDCSSRNNDAGRQFVRDFMVEQIGGRQISLATSQFVGSSACSCAQSYPHNENLAPSFTRRSSEAHTPQTGMKLQVPTRLPVVRPRAAAELHRVERTTPDPALAHVLG